MEDSSRLRKRKKSTSVEVKMAKSSSNAEENTGNVQNVDLPHLVVAKILENLNFEDLLQCSLINKVWNYEARRSLREKHECALTVDLGIKSPEDITDFKTMLATSALPLPYRSLFIVKMEKPTVMEESFVKWTKTTKELETLQIAIKDLILRAGPFKVVRLDLRCRGEFSFEVWFTRNVLAEVRQTVEVLKIKNLYGGHVFFYVTKLPELKELEVDLKAEISILDEISLQNLIIYSPKLETVGCFSLKLLRLLKKLPPSRKLELAKEFAFADGSYLFLEEVEQFVALEPKLEKLFISRQPFYFVVDDPSSISTRLLLSSQFSLIELHAPFELLLKICREEQSFLNLRYIEMETPPWVGDPKALRLCDNIMSLCPKLEKIEIVGQR